MLGNASFPLIDLLVLVHPSNQNQAQERLAVDLAAHLRGRVHLLGLAASPPEKTAIVPKLEWLQSQLAAAGLVAEVTVETVETDSAAIAIRNVGIENRPRLVVVGDLGRNGLMQRLLGPIALDLLDALTDSLLFVPPNAPITVRHILLAIGALSYSQRAVDMAGLIAQAYSAQVTLLHTVYPNQYAPDALVEPTNMRDFLTSDSLFAQNFRQAITFLEDRGVVVVPRLRRGSPLHQIRAETRSTPYDLAVIGSHYSAGNFAHLMGGISQSIVRQAGIPVLVARSDLEST